MTVVKTSPHAARVAPKPKHALLVIAMVAMLLDSCAVLRSAQRAEGVFLSEEDPSLAADTFPLLIKASEILLEGSPQDQGKLVSTASLYVMYGSAFIQGEAEFLPDSRYGEKQEANARAGAFYTRALKRLEPALERRAPGLIAALAKGAKGAASPSTGSMATADPKILLARLKAPDVPLLYWTAAALLAKYSLNPLDMDGSRALLIAPILLNRAEQLSPGWNKGSVQELFVSFYAAMPEYMGGGMTLAEAAWNKAFSYSKGSSASLYVSRAVSFAVPADDYSAFKKNLELALAIDVDTNPESRLSTEIAKRRARRLLASADSYFLIPEEGNTP